MTLWRVLVFACTLLANSVHGQIVNSLSPNKTGLYTHALDSCLGIILKDKPLHRIYITGNDCATTYLPDTVRGVAIVKNNIPKKLTANKLSVNEMIVMIKCITIIRDEVTVSVVTPREGDWLYQFIYYYRPQTMDYYLKTVKTGMEL